MLNRRGWFLLAAAGLFACSRRHRSAQDEVRDTIDALETAVEARDLSALRDLLSERFAADEVADRPEALALVRAVWARHPHIHLLVRVAAIELQPPAGARATVLVAAAGHPITGVGDLARVSADILTFELALAKETPSRWRVLSATWNEGRPQDFLADP